MENRFTLIRKLLNYTQKNFAKKISVSQSFWADVERGYRNPSHQTITLLEKEVGVSKEWLKRGEGLMFSDWRKGLETIKGRTVLSIYELEFLVNVMQHQFSINSEQDTRKEFIKSLKEAMDYLVREKKLPEQNVYMMENYSCATADNICRAIIRIMQDVSLNEKDCEELSYLLLPWGYYVALSYSSKKPIKSILFENIDFINKEIELNIDDMPKVLDLKTVGVYILARPGINEKRPGAYTIHLKEKNIYVDMTIYNLVEIILLFKNADKFTDSEVQSGDFAFTIIDKNQSQYPFALKQKNCVFTINFSEKEYEALLIAINHFYKYENFLNLAFKLYVNKFGFI